MAGDPRLLFQAKSLPIPAIRGHDALLPFTFTAGTLAGSHPLLARIKGDWGGSARAQGGPQEASDGFWRSKLCDRPPTPKRLSAGRAYSQDLW